MPKLGIPVYSALIISILFSLGCAQKTFRQVCLKDLCIRAEVADTPLKRQAGLMHRNVLGQKEGMLFIFEREGRHNFWMKNMQIPLDIIWISADKRVVGILPQVQPCAATCPSLTIGKASKYVLEVNSGLAEKYQLKTGEAVNF